MSTSEQWFLGEPLDAVGQIIDGWHFTDSKEYNGPIPSTVPVSHPGPERQFSFAALDMPVVSSSVADAIRAINPAGLEMFPVEIGLAERDYLILNVLNQARCVDEVRSKAMKWTEADERPDKLGGYQMIVDLTIDPDRTNGHDIFRITGYTVALIVSEAMKVSLERLGTIGIVFESVAQ